MVVYDVRWTKFVIFLPATLSQNTDQLLRLLLILSYYGLENEVTSYHLNISFPRILHHNHKETMPIVGVKIVMNVHAVCAELLQDAKSGNIKHQSMKSLMERNDIEAVVKNSIISPKTVIRESISK